MIARLAYHDSTYSLCARHYDSPPPGLPPLGGVEDSRRSSCEVCDSTACLASWLTDPRSVLDQRPRWQGQIERRAEIELPETGTVSLKHDPSDGEVRVSLDGWETSDVVDVRDLPPDARRVLDSLS